MDRVKHQLNVHCDFKVTSGELEWLHIRYSYPHSAPALREQMHAPDLGSLKPDLVADLTELYRLMSSMHPPPIRVRLPHAAFLPEVAYGILTLVAQDQKRVPELPKARLYYYETIRALKSQAELQIHRGRGDWSASELPVATRCAQAVKKIAWLDYERLVGEHLFPQ